MSRIPHLLARIAQRSTPRTTLSQQTHLIVKPFSTTTHRLNEHNLSSPSRAQPTSPDSPPTRITHPTYFPPLREEALSSRSFYRTHGRALFKALTLAFFTYQVLYWAWLSLETEEAKDSKNREIRALEGEVRLLDEGRKSHGEALKKVVRETGEGEGSKRILEEPKR